MLALTTILIPFLLFLWHIAILSWTEFNLPLLLFHTQCPSRSDNAFSNLTFGILEVASRYFESAT